MKRSNKEVDINNGSFKWVSLIGRILSDLAIDGTTKYDLSSMRLDRPALTDPHYESDLFNQLTGRTKESIK